MDKKEVLFTPTYYVNRPGCFDAGQDYEIKIATLLLLSSVGKKTTEHSWVAMNVESCGAFDDVVLYRKTKDKEIVYLVQLKHGQSGSDVRAEEFRTKQGGPFHLKKYFDDIGAIRGNPALSYLFERAKIVFALFTNRGTTEGCDFLLEVSKNSPPDKQWALFESLDTANGKIFQFDYAKLSDFAQDDFFLFTKQMHIANLDGAIGNAIKNLIQPVKVTKEVLADLGLKLSVFVEDWSQGRLGGFYPLTKKLVMEKVIDILLEPYKLKLTPKQEFKFDHSLWSKLIDGKDVVVVDKPDEDVLDFVQEHTLALVGQYQNDKVRTGKKISNEEMYEMLWKSTKAPLLIKVGKFEKKQVANMIKISRGLFRYVLLEEDEAAKIKIPNSFVELSDLNPELQRAVLDIPVKLQGKESTLTLGKVKNLTTKQIVHILIGKFNVGNEFEPLPDFFVDIKLKRIWLEEAVLKTDETFTIQCKSEFNFQLFLRKFDLDLDYSSWGEKKTHRIVIILEEEAQGDFWTTNHFLVLHDMYGLEWISSRESIKSVEKFRKFAEDSKMPAIELTRRVVIKGRTLISANPGMGKTILLNYIALNASNYWTVKINLPEHKECLKNWDRSKSVHGFLKNPSDLEKGIFDDYLKNRKVLFLLDAFDEVPITCQAGARDFMTFIIDSNFPLCVTMRPYMKNELESLLKTFAIDICLFTRRDQEYYLESYFARIGEVKREDKKVTGFVKDLLDMSKRNLNHHDSEFTGVPLQTLLLAEVFEADFLNSLLGKSFVIQPFDLLFLYSKFVEKKNKIAFAKIESTSEDMIGQYKIFRTVYALQALFDEEDLKTLNIVEQYESAAAFFPNLLGLIQKDGIVVAEDEGKGVTFVHFTFAEYLVAVWLSENLTGSTIDQVRVLVKKTFQHNFVVVRNIFDRIVCKDCPLHLAITNRQVGAVKTLAKTEMVTQKDPCERSVVHMIASWGLHHPVDYKKGCKPILSKKEVVEDPMIEILALIPAYNVSNETDKLLGFNPLDYAYISGSLNVANAICARVKGAKPSMEPSLIDVNYTQSYTTIFNYLDLSNCIVKYCCGEKHVPIHLVFEELYADKRALESYMENLEVKNQATILHWSVIYGNLDALNLILSKGVDINIKDDNNMTALHWAARYGLKAPMEFLLSAGANLEERDEIHMTALHWCVHYNATDCVKMLLSKGADPDARTINGMTVLHMGAIGGDIDIVKSLLKHGAKLGNRCDAGLTALHYAANTESVEIVKFLLSKGANLRARSNAGITPLHLASYGCWIEGIDCIIPANQDESPKKVTIKPDAYLEILKILLAKGAKIEEQDQDGHTPLMFAALFGKKEIAQFLLAEGANLEAQDENGKTPLDCAAKNGHLDVVEMLVLKGAKTGPALFLAAENGHAKIVKLLLSIEGRTMEQRNQQGKTILSCAARNGHADTVRMILSQGAQIETTTFKHATPLHLAAFHGHTRTVEALLENGAKIEATTHKPNMTPLYMAYCNNHPAIVNLLLAKGADHSALGENKLTWWAIKNNHVKTFELLLSKNVDLNIKTKDNYAPVHVAAQKGHVAILALLIGAGADIEAKGPGGSPFKLGLRNRHVAVLNFLMLQGAKVELADRIACQNLLELEKESFLNDLKMADTGDDALGSSDDHTEKFTEIFQSLMVHLAKAEVKPASLQRFVQKKN